MSYYLGPLQLVEGLEVRVCDLRRSIRHHPLILVAFAFVIDTILSVVTLAFT